MYFLALATDYDGTIAQHSGVSAETVEALRKFKETGRRAILVTGRDLPDLKRIFPELALFDRVVAENGALIYDPGAEKQRAIAAPPPVVFIEKLRERKVEPLSVGESIVATWEPNEKVVLEIIRELGLELQIIFNKGAVMVLPSGMNKAAGLVAALGELGLTPHNVVGVGDAQNDHAFLKVCGCSAAVANALPIVKESADIVLEKDHGPGVADLLDMICRKDGALLPAERHGLALGTDGEGNEIHLAPYAGSILIAGRSGIGKSTLAKALTERMVEREFEFCVFDPEGDYAGLENAVSVGNAKDAPDTDEALTLLTKIGANLVINTQALDVAERPLFFAGLLPQIASLRAKTGRPHWLILDEAHHLLPAGRENTAQVMPEELPATIFVTVHPEAMSAEALKTVETVLVLGKAAETTIRDFCKQAGISPPKKIPRPGDEEIVFWRPAAKAPPRLVTPTPPRQLHRRHTRKYAEGDLGEELSFYFRGPEGKLNLRAQNLAIFTQLAEGVDDGTWIHHLKAGEYSAWFRNVIKDEELAEEAAEVEADRTLSASDSRKRIAEAISRRYTAPARAAETEA